MAVAAVGTLSPLSPQPLPPIVIQPLSPPTPTIPHQISCQEEDNSADVLTPQSALDLTKSVPATQQFSSHKKLPSAVMRRWQSGASVYTIPHPVPIQLQHMAAQGVTSQQAGYLTNSAGPVLTQWMSGGVMSIPYPVPIHTQHKSTQMFALQPVTTRQMRRASTYMDVDAATCNTIQPYAPDKYLSSKRHLPDYDTSDERQRKRHRQQRHPSSQLYH